MGLRLNLGCGANCKEGWVNADIKPRDGCPAMVVDVSQPWPWARGSAEYVYSEHLLEHLERGEGILYVVEAFRVLESGGTIRIGVPDASLPILWYLQAGGSDFNHEIENFHPKWLNGAMEHVQYSYRMSGAHKWGYDDETLQSLVRSAGFVKVKEDIWRPDLDSEVRRIGTIYVEGVKP